MAQRRVSPPHRERPWLTILLTRIRGPSKYMQTHLPFGAWGLRQDWYWSYNQHSRRLLIMFRGQGQTQR